MQESSENMKIEDCILNKSTCSYSKNLKKLFNYEFYDDYII